MKTCPKCGAENRQTATECRLCATTLAGSPPAPVNSDTAPGEQLPPTRIVSGRFPAPSPAQKICSACQTANEPDWVFCQSCGKKLPDTVQEDAVAAPAQKATTAPQTPRPSQQPPAAAPEQNQAVVGNADRDTLKDLARRKPAEQTPPPASQSPSVSPPSSIPPAASPPEGFATVQTPVVPGAGLCPKCGATTTPTGFFCANCGAKLVPPIVAASGPAPRHVLQLITEGGQVGDVYPIQNGQTAIGRNDGDITFPHDGYLSGRHARVVERGGRFFLIDNSSRNGTFVRIKGEVEIESGDTFLVGKQIFKLEKA